jgi:hypothetical protein
VKKIVLAAAILAIGASVQAANHVTDGVTVHARYGHEAHQLQVRRVHKDTTRFASSVKTDDAATAVPAAAPKEPAKTPDVDAPAAATNAAPAK